MEIGDGAVARDALIAFLRGAGLAAEHGDGRGRYSDRRQKSRQRNPGTTFFLLCNSGSLMAVFSCSSRLLPCRLGYLQVVDLSALLHLASCSHRAIARSEI
jgi:hypothetical protein